METRTKKPLNKCLLNECAPGMPASLAGSSGTMQAGCPMACMPLLSFPQNMKWTFSSAPHSLRLLPTYTRPSWLRVHTLISSACISPIAHSPSIYRVLATQKAFYPGEVQHILSRGYLGCSCIYCASNSIDGNWEHPWNFKKETLRLVA